MANPADHYARRPAFTSDTPVTARRNALGEWIRTTRIAHGMSQRALAERAGVSRSYLCDIERGRGAQPTVATLDKLARALGASRIELLRVAGILDPIGGRAGDDRERRLLACFRSLSAESQAAVERFAQFCAPRNTGGCNPACWTGTRMIACRSQQRSAARPCLMSLNREPQRGG